MACVMTEGVRSRGGAGEILTVAGWESEEADSSPESSSVSLTLSRGGISFC